MNRTEKSQGTNEDASIGIGAMIVFIALILVAAVASAVIIQTAEKLQQTAQQTGQDTQAEQGTKIIVLGTIVSSGIAAGAVIMTFELGAGSVSIADTAVSYTILCDNGAAIGAITGDFSGATNLGGLGGPATFVPGTAYEVPISYGGTAVDCDLAISTDYQLFIGVSGGGSTFEILSSGLSITAGEELV